MWMLFYQIAQNVKGKPVAAIFSKPWFETALAITRAISYI
jgi:hypothetical protein